MPTKNILLRSLLLLLFLTQLITPDRGASASDFRSRQELASSVTAFDLIIAMNTLRMSYGLPALIEDPIINAVAQSTAEIMAASQMSWHIGDVRGRLAAAGYGGGATVWGTENFAVGGSLTLDEIMFIWSDPSHMIPAVNPAYCHIGAGVATAPNGSIYYILQAAYTSTNSCGPYTSVAGATQPAGGATRSSGVSQFIVPVKIATPDSDGKIFHVVEPGQSLWAIAVAYKITIKDLELWNNLVKDSKLQIGEKLFIPSSNTIGYATPTPVGMVIPSTPGPDGKIIHTVQPYNTLTTISKAYGVTIQRILDLNGLQIDWPLSIGQQLVISPGLVTPSPTPRPLTPIEKLTPDPDGNYYHVVKSGENLSWIADLYVIQVAQLLDWNKWLGLSTVLQPEQKLLLQVTPPVIETPTQTPAPVTPTATLALPSRTPTQEPTLSLASITATAPPASPGIDIQGNWFVFLGLIAGGTFFLILLVSRGKNK